MKFFSKLLRDESGATAIEYGLIAALIAVAAIIAMSALGANLRDTFQGAANKVQEGNELGGVDGSAAE